MTAVTLQLDEHPSADELRQIVDGVRSFNRTVAGYEPPRSVACFLRDEGGRIVGGAQGDLWGVSVHIAGMWVAKNYRGKGYGSALLTAVENYAADQGHLLSYLETTSFQARPFYEGLGYSVFGELPGIAEGCTLVFLKKELKARAAEDLQASESNIQASHSTKGRVPSSNVRSSRGAALRPHRFTR